MTNPSSHRRFNRAPFSGSVAMWRERQPHVVKARNLSCGGVYIQTEQSVDEGCLLTLRLSLPGERGFTVLGRVVRTQSGRSHLRKPGIAVEFVDISPRHRAEVDGYVNRDQTQVVAYA